MEKLSHATESVIDENVEKLAELFPEVVTEVREPDGSLRHTIDVDALKERVGDVAEGQRERYQFTWPGKREAKQEAYRQIDKCLRPCPEESVDWDTTGNLYIEGDNLDALKLLRNTYAGKVKMIYIDPPYNTGHDFIYDDDFAQTKADYVAESGDYDEDGGRLVANPESNGRFHSDWCSMMYPRLLLARDLLSEDGAIFISIDDNEVSNLTTIVKEVFGQSNLINTIAVNMSNMSGPKIQHAITGKRYPKIKEYLLICSKDLTRYSLRIPKLIKSSWDPEYNQIIPELTLSEFETIYSNDVDYSTAEKILSEKTIVSLNSYIKENNLPNTLEWKLDNSYRIFASKPNSALLRMASELSFTSQLAPICNASGQIKIIRTDFNRQTRTARIELANARVNAESFLGDQWGDIVTTGGVAQEGGVPFENGKKPIKLLRRAIDCIATEGNEIILDFFSGSASTAHAVIKLNAEDGCNRKFIMVQLPEVCYEKSEAAKAGYKNICEIGKERIRRAGKKIAEEVEESNRQLKPGEEPKKVPDVGFRVLKIDSSNFEDVSAEPGEFSQNAMLRFADNLKLDRTPDDLIIQVMLKKQIELSAPIEKLDVDGRTVFSVDNGRLVACFDRDVPVEVMTSMAKMEPDYAVMRDASFAGDDAVSNFAEIFKNYSSITEVEVI